MSEATLESDLLGCNVGAAIHGILLAPCAAGLDRSTSHEKLDAARRIEGIRQGIPSLATTLRQRSVVDQLTLFAQAAPPHRLDLPPEAWALVDNATAPPPGVTERLVLRHAWREHVRLHGALEASADLPDRERMAAFQAVASEAARSWNPLTAASFEKPEDFTSRHFTGLAALDALRLGTLADAFRSETSRWPAGQEDLVRAGFLESPIPDVRTGAAVSLEVRDGAIWVPVGESGVIFHPDRP